VEIFDLDRKVKILAIPIVILIGITYFFYSESQENKIRDEAEQYITNFKLEFTGIITNIDLIDHDIGMVRLDLKTSNIDNYNYETPSGIYYCVIKNGQAELIEAPCSERQNNFRHNLILKNTSRNEIEYLYLYQE
jgi:hypothetical protein